MEIIRQLWSREEDFDFEGRYYRIVRGESWPKPIQRPYPAIMNAGGSDKGAHFAAKYADMCFVIAGKGGIDEMTAHAAEYKRLAREEYGREVQVWTTSPVIVRPSEHEVADEARRQQEALNPAYLKQLQELRGEQAKALQVPGRDAPKVATTANDALKLIGTPEQIVDGVAALSAAGIDGVVLTSDTLEGELPLLIDRVLPLLEQAGLRDPVRA